MCLILYAYKSKHYATATRMYYYMGKNYKNIQTAACPKFTFFLSKIMELRNMYTAEEIDVWRTTSTWSLEQLNLLCLKIYDEDFEVSTYDDNILYYGSHKILLSGINIHEYSQKLSERENWSFDETPFLNRLYRLMTQGKECLDSPMFDLLNDTGFETRHLHFVRKPRLDMEWCGIDIKCEAEYAVYSLTPKFVHMVALEDIPSHRRHEDMECQLAGDMLVAAMNRVRALTHPHTEYQCVHGIILQRDKLTFYQADFPTLYLLKMGSGTYPDPEIMITREGTFSLFDGSGRKEIVASLTRIKDRAEHNARSSISPPTLA